MKDGFGTRNICIIFHNHERFRHFWEECITIEPLFDFRQIHPIATIRLHGFLVHTVAANHPDVFNIRAVACRVKLVQCLLKATANKHIRRKGIRRAISR